MVFVLTLDVTLKKLRTMLQTSGVLTLTGVGFLGVRFAIPCLKLVRTML